MPAPIRRAAALGLLSLATVAVPRAAVAQLPGAPVLQNAFSNRGLTGAVNFATGEESSLIAGAIAFAPGTGRFQFSGGLGRLSPDEGDAATAWGARVGVPLFSFAGGRAGLAPFLGVGGASREGASVLQVPVGVGAGWRMGLGATRALSVYATGTFLWARASVEGADSESNGLVRVAAAADVTLIRKLALTVGYEAGQKADLAEPGPAGSIFGVGLSWAFR